MNLQNLIGGLQSTAGIGGNIGASMGGSSFEELQKALTATTYQTDVSQLTGGSALTIQSLDRVMKVTVQQNKHFTLFNKLKVSSATNVVDEYIRQTSVGGVIGGSFSTQMAQVRSATGDYKREVGLSKFQMQLRQVGFVQNIGNNIESSIALEESNGAKSLMTDAEYKLFYGNSAVCPVEFDGVFVQIDSEIAAGRMAPESVYDMDGQKVNDIAPFSAIEAAVMDYDSWGGLTDAYLTPAVQADLNYGLDPSFRWTPEGTNTPTIGGHVSALRMQASNKLATNSNTFLHGANHPMVKPWDGDNKPGYAAVAASNVGIKPASVTVDASASDTSSRFYTARAGNYYYAVAAVDAEGKGLSGITKSSQVAIAAGKKAVLTITQSAAGTETGYAIYRSRQNGTNDSGDFRLMKMIPKAAGSTTTFTDLNRDLPGATSIPLLNLSSEDDAICWRQYQPMTKIMLPFGVGLMPQHSWFQFLFGYLRIAKPKHHGYVKNVVPGNAVWRPHTAE